MITSPYGRQESVVFHNKAHSSIWYVKRAFAKWEEKGDNKRKKQINRLANSKAIVSASLANAQWVWCLVPQFVCIAKKKCTVISVAKIYLYHPQHVFF